MRSTPHVLLLIAAMLMVSCASNKNKESDAKTEDLPQAHQVPIEVGGILTKLEILDAESYILSENQLAVKVIEVLAYGASTQPLAVDEVLTLVISESLRKNTSFKSLSAGTVFEGIIRKSRGMNSSSSTDNWNLVEIKETE